MKDSDLSRWGSLSLVDAGDVEHEREVKLRKALEKEDHEELRRIATSPGGFPDTAIRSKAWNILLETPTADTSDEWEQLPPHKDEEQVALDVNRSSPFRGSSIETSQFKDRLQRLIVRTLRHNYKLSYYQGFHDVAAMFLSTFNDDQLAFENLNRFLLLHLRDFMMPTIDSSIRVLAIVPQLVQKIDTSTYKDLVLDNMEPFYALSSIVTLFTHDIRNFDTISLVFDHIIATRTVSVAPYLYTSLVLLKHDKILEKVHELEEDEMFSRHDLVHNSLSKFTRELTKSDVQEALSDVGRYMIEYPLHRLPCFKKLGVYSVLRSDALLTDNAHKDRLIEEQIRESEKMELEQPTLIAKIWSSKTNQQVIKLSLAIGVASIILNAVFVRSTGTGVFPL